MAAPAPIRRAEGFYRELELVRIQWSKPEELGLAVASAATRHGGGELRPWWKMELGDGNGGGSEGEATGANSKLRQESDSKKLLER